ncbi:MAG: hypothetical protein JWO86_3316 [Myxococcaceae bacterium]|nr:hypothetical protein [Myxococcaceae bacterium]
MTLARSVVVMASAMALLAACGGKSIGDDLSSTPDPNNPNPNPIPSQDAGPDAPGCTFNGARCDPGDVAVASEAGCGDADYCYSRRAGCPDALLWCAHRTVQCGAIPRCDQGDEQVTQCPDPAPNSALTCYPRSVCGSTIQCVHRDACTSLPSCQPGDIEVTAISTCSMKGVSCYSVTECNYTIHCYTP